MLTLATSCDGDLLQILSLVQKIIGLLKIAVPVILIIFGTITMAKAVASSDEKAIKSAQKTLITQLIAAAVVFIIPTIVSLVVGIVGGDIACYNEAANCGFMNSDENPCQDVSK